MADLRNPINDAGCIKSGSMSICVGPGAIRRVCDRLVSTLVRTEARSLAEQQIMQGQINDPRYPRGEWAKMQHIHETPSAQSIVIHYWERLRDSFRTGFKFKG